MSLFFKKLMAVNEIFSVSVSSIDKTTEMHGLHNWQDKDGESTAHCSIRNTEIKQLGISVSVLVISRSELHRQKDICDDHWKQV